MIIEKQKQADVLSEGISQETIEMGLDLDSTQFLMQMLSKNLYSDPIGSTVRELCSNALDSHRRAGVEEPVIVSLNKGNSSYEFSVTDFGTGLDDIDVREIISKYGKSTKRGIANEFGMFGIGFKSPLSYTSSFVFITRKDGIERSYMMYEGEDVNNIDLLYEQPTSERNGTIVRVPVNYYEKAEFITKIKEQLAYFRNVYFDVVGEELNNFNLYESDDFIVSTLCNDSSMHICLDNVYYPIDFSKLGISRIHSNVALKFSLTDGLVPTPNRESIRYTQESKALILGKISKVADYFIQKYNNEVADFDDAKDLFNFYDDEERFVNIDILKINIDDLINHSSVQVKVPRLKGVSLIDVEGINSKFYKDVWIEEYKVKYSISYKRIKETSNNSLSYYNIIHGTILIMNIPLTYIIKDYIRYKYNSGNGLIVKKLNPFTLKRSFYDHSYFSLLNLDKHPKHEWRQRIKEFQLVRDNLMKNAVVIDSNFVPKTYLDFKKTAKSKSARKTVSLNSSSSRKMKLKGEVIGKQAEKHERYVQGKNCKFESRTFEIETIHRNKGIIIYGKHDQDSKLDKLFPIFKKDRVKLMTFSDRELKILSKVSIHNLISYEKFMDGTHIVFRRAVTAYLINNLMNDEGGNIFKKLSCLKEISTSLYDKMISLKQYRDKYYTYADTMLYNDLLTIANNNNWFDSETYTLYNEVKEILNKFPFINDLIRYNSLSYNIDQPKSPAPLKNAIIKLCKYEQFRLNLENYNIINN